MGLHVYGEVEGVGDIPGDQGGPVGTVQVGSGYHGELAVVQPVDKLLDWIDGNLARIVCCRFIDNLSVCSIQPTDLGIMVDS